MTCLRCGKPTPVKYALLPDGPQEFCTTCVFTTPGDEKVRREIDLFLENADWMTAVLMDGTAVVRE